MKDAEKWNKDVQKLRGEMLTWAYGQQTSWKAHAIFIGLLSTIALLCLAFGLMPLFWITIFFLGIQVIRVIVSKVKEKFNKKY